MSQAEKKVACPACAHEFNLRPDADLAHLVCPHCEAEIPEQAVRGLAEVAEDLALGFKPGHRLGNYIIESLLGSGGMAVVFRGRQLSLNRVIAIKILPKDLAKNRLFIQRFTSEAAVLANLNHPNIVSVIDRGREGETYFIVMEYVEGETLKDRLRREGKLAPDQILRIGEQVLAGLEYAHRRGVVHRDIKPGNLMVNREEIVKIADFGLAHLAKTQGGLDVTRDNQTMGTLKYMAPEQLTSAKNIDGRTDLYSLGVCLYELLTGKLPLGMFKMPSEVDSALDVRWDEIILRSLRMDPEERYSGADEMARALRELATTPRITLAQREKEEEAAAKVKGVTNLTACAACGHESVPTAHECEQCGASLADIFDECPSCKIENRLDVPKCPGCGANLASHRDQSRRVAEAIQAKAMRLVADHQFELALLQLKKLGLFRTREYASVRESARLWIERVMRKRERFYRQTYEAGQRMVAEGRAERALEIWAALPDNYEKLGERRKELLARIEAAKAAAAEGRRLYDQGDLVRAVAEWEKAAAFRTRDLELKKHLAAARIRLGNLNLKRSYLRESGEAADRGDFAEALALCRKVLELDPDDASALLVEKDLAAKGRESHESEVRAAPKVKKLPKPSAKRRPLNVTPLFLILGFLAAIALVLWITFVYLPHARAGDFAAAESLYREAEDLKAQGKLSEAIQRCTRISRQYPSTPYAHQADALSQEMQKLNAEAYGLCQEAEAAARKGDLESLIAGFKKYQKIVGVPPVSAVVAHHDFALRRLDQLRQGIAEAEVDLGAQDERNGDWQEALKRYRRVAEEFGFNGEPISSKTVRAKKRLDDCAEQVSVGQRALKAAQWDNAYHAAVAALDLVPADHDAGRLLTDVTPKLTPPVGMLLVPAGKYVVGGGEGNPAHAFVSRFGFFIDATEVTRARYAAFLRDTKRPPPRNLSEDGPPQAGTEQMPVVNITWSEAAAFAAWAGCALPAEEQWECACRGPLGLLYSWGDTWAPANAELGFGPAPVGAAPRDRSPYGCMDMAGNVAEWTATRLDSAPGAPPSPVPGATLAPAKTALYVVKGNSWLGTEKERPTFAIVTPVPEGPAEATPPLLLSSDPKTPEWAVRYPANIEMEYLGIVGTEDAYVLVRRWMPGWDRWAEAKFQVKSGEKIGDTASVVVEDAARIRRRAAQVDLSTGCIALNYDKAWLDVREPAGVVRRLKLPDINASGLRPAKLNDWKDVPQPAAEMTLERAVSAPMRMAGRENARYVNVGFRCVKMLWPLAPAAQNDPQAAGKQ